MYKRLTVGYIAEKPAEETIWKAKSAKLFKKNKMWNKVRWIAKITINGTTWCIEVTKLETYSNEIAKFVAVSLNLREACWQEFNLSFKKCNKYSCTTSSYTSEKLL